MIWRIPSKSHRPPWDKRASRSETRRQGITWTRTPKHSLRALYEKNVPLVWNDLMREVERIRRSKDAVAHHALISLFC